MNVRDMTDDQIVADVNMSAQTQFQAPFLLEMQRRLIVAVRAASDSADNFARQAQVLNRSVRTYTIAMFALAIVQVAMLIWKK